MFLAGNIRTLSILANSTSEEGNGWLLKYLISSAQDLLVIQLAKGYLQWKLIRYLSVRANRRGKCCTNKLANKIIDPFVVCKIARD